MDAIKIQINSKEALERLIGGDRDVEIAVKNAVVNQFARQYLKSVANSEVMNELKEAVISEVRETVKEYVGKASGWSKEYVIKDEELKEAVGRAVKDAFKELVRETVKEQFAPLEKEVKEQLGIMTDSVLSRISERSLERTMRDYIRKKLDL